MSRLTSEFRPSPTHGFCPSTPSLAEPPAELAVQYTLARDPEWLATIQNHVEEIPELPVDALQNWTEEEINLGCLVYAVFVNSFYWQDETPTIQIPPVISQPLCALYALVERPPIISLASIQFHNWAYIDPAGPFHADNLKSLILFTGLRDEEYFYHCATYIEYLGAPLIQSLLKLIEGEAVDVTQELGTAACSMHEMRKAVSLLYSRVDPQVFYHVIRRRLSSYDKNVVFQGVSETPQYFVGGSAAQTPIFAFINAALGIEFESPFAQYILKSHREFIQEVKTRGVDLKALARESNSHAEWNKLVKELVRFRKSHFKLVVDYVLKPSQSKTQVGTGGSSMQSFLSDIIAKTEALIIE